MSHALTIDPVTGICDRNPALREAVYETARRSGPDSFLIEGDFTNMRGLNDALGHAAGNRFIQFVTRTYRDEIAALSPAYIYAYRQIGDEVSLIVEGISEQELAAALEKASEKVSQFTTETGLDFLQHGRYPDKIGVGFATACQNIAGETRPFPELHDELQEKIAAGKKTSLNADPAAIRSSRDFINNASTARFYQALSDFLPAGSPGNGPPPLPSGMTDIPAAEAPLLDSNRRNTDLRQAIADGGHTLMRFELHNLSGLNSRLGPVDADILIDHVRTLIAETFEQNGYDVRLYRAGPGMFDVLMPETDERAIDRLKIALHDRVYDEIFGKSITGYAQIHPEMLESGDELIGLIPDKNGTQFGTGLLMVHRPVAQNQSIGTILASAESVTQIQKLHGAAFLEKTDGGRLRLYNLYPVGQDSSVYETIENRDPESAYAFPYARSLAERIPGGKLSEMFRQPCGRIMQSYFGYDLTPVLERQKTMEGLIESKTATQEEIVNRVNSIASFDFWLASQGIDRDSFNVQDRAETRIRMDTRLMTMGLATQWNVVPKDLYETVLQAQAGIRCIDRTDQLDKGAAHMTAGYALSYLENDIRTHMQSEANDGLRRIQTTEQVISALHHAEAFTGQSTDERINAALAVLTGDSLKQVSGQFEARGESTLATHFATLAENRTADTGNLPDIEEAHKIVTGAITGLTEKIAGADMPASQKEKILFNLSVLSDCLNSSRESELAATAKGGKGIRPDNAPQPLTPY